MFGIDDLVSEAESKHFDEHGYIGPYTLYSPEEAGEIERMARQEILGRPSRVFEHTEVWDDPHFDFSILASSRDRHLDSPLLYRLASSPEVLGRVAHLLGPDIVLWRSDFFPQPVGRKTYPHQDLDFAASTALFPCIEATTEEGTVDMRGCGSGPVRVPRTVTAYIGITPSEKETGALWVIPGSHNKGRIPEVELAEGEEGAFGHRTRPDIDTSPEERQTLALEPGQFYLFDNFILHASHPTLKGDRLSWGARYVSPSTRLYPRGPLNPQGQDMSRYGGILVAGQDRQQLNRMNAPPPIRGGRLSDEKAAL